MEVFYGEMLKKVKDSRKRLRRIREDYQSTKDILQARRNAVEELYGKLLVQKKIEEIFQLLEDAKNLDHRVDELMQKKNFCLAIEQLKFLDTMLYNMPLINLKALDDMRARSMQRLEKCHRKISFEDC